MKTLWCYFRMIWRGRWIVVASDFGQDGWRARHTRTGATVGGDKTTRALAAQFCKTANFS